MTDNTPHNYEVGTAPELQQKHGWNAESWKPAKIDPETVPPHLRDLIPFAERWGIKSDVTRHDVAAKADPKELAKLADELHGRHEEIAQWLDSIGLPGPTNPYPKAAGHFIVMCVMELEELDGPGLRGAQ
jgi:hypothetical protein